MLLLYKKNTNSIKNRVISDIHAGWHMNKKHWISIYEDEDLDPDLAIDLVHSSYELVVSKLNKLQRQRIAALKAIT